MELRAYGVQTTIYFPLIDNGATDFESTPVSFAAGDVQIMKDGGAFANATNSVAHEGNGIYSLVLTATEMQAAQVVVTLIDSATKTWEDQAITITTFGNGSAEFQHFPADTKAISGDTTAADNCESMFDGTGYAATASSISADVTSISGDQTAADNCEAFFDNTGFNASNSAIGTVASVTAIASAERNAIADALLVRDIDQVEGSAPDHSLTTALLKLVSRVVVGAGALTIYRTDGSTTHATQTVTTDDTASPVTATAAAS